MVKIEEIHLSEDELGKQLSAKVDGEPVWFHFPGWVPVKPRPEFFLPLALAEAMVRGEDIVIDERYPLSTMLSSSIPEIVTVHCAWNQDDNRPIGIRARSEIPVGRWDAVLCCFSGGIDSSFSFGRHRDEISHLLVVMGFDESTQGAAWEKLHARLKKAAATHGKGLITVETNLRQVFNARRLSWNAAHGSVLAAIGVALQCRMLIIPASYDYSNLFPWGSHPLLDPLWATETTSVLHDGLGYTRSQKTLALMNDQDLLDAIQVCWKHVDHNCGTCSKCVRTSLALHLLGGQSASLPAFDPKGLSVLRPSSLTSIPFVNDLISIARRRGRGDIADTLIRYRSQCLIKHHSIEAVRAVLGRRVQTIAAHFRPKSWHKQRTKITGAMPF